VIWNRSDGSVSAGHLAINGVNLTTGETAWLHPGPYTGTLTAPTASSSWDPDGGLTVTASTATAVTVGVTTDGTIEADG